MTKNLIMWELLKKIKTKLPIIPLIILVAKLENKINLLIFKSKFKVINLLGQKLRFQLRVLISDARLEGYDEKLDLIIHLTSLKFLNPEIFEDNPPEFLFYGLTDELQKTYSDLKVKYADNKEKIDGFIEAYGQNKNIVELISSYNLVKHAMANYLKKDKAADYYLIKAKSKDPSVLPLNNNDLVSLKRSFKKDINKLKSEIADRQAIKISLSIEKTVSLISFVSALFIISGYLYNRFLLGSFGIEVSKYFTIGDYLASSIESIESSAIGAAVGLISYFVGVHRASRESIVYERKNKEYLVYLMLLIAIIGTIKSYLDNSEQFYLSSWALIIFFSVYYMPLLTKKYFKEPLAVLFILVFLASYSAHMFYSVGKAIYRAKNYSFEKIRKYDFKFKNDLKIDESKIAFIAGNSNYLFFLNNEREAFIIPRDQVIYFKVLKIDEKSNKLSQQPK